MFESHESNKPEHAHDVVPDALRVVPFGVGLVVILDAVLVPLVVCVSRVERGASGVLGTALETRHQVGESQGLRGHTRRRVARIHHRVRDGLRRPG